jgi:DNA-binding transcriptional LysR family regulator
MDRLRGIEIFIQVAQGLSFSAAAQRKDKGNARLRQDKR